MATIGTMTARKTKRPRLTFGVCRYGYEMFISSRQKGWKSGLTTERASAMTMAALVDGQPQIET